MPNYRVKLVFLYSDVVHVEAPDKDAAEKMAMAECQEEYEYYYDAEITEE